MSRRGRGDGGGSPQGSKDHPPYKAQTYARLTTWRTYDKHWEFKLLLTVFPVVISSNKLVVITFIYSSSGFFLLFVMIYMTQRGDE